jgi:hypothetical protein
MVQPVVDRLERMDTSVVVTTATDTVGGSPTVAAKDDMVDLPTEYRQDITSVEYLPNYLQKVLA